jgi:hypothetical protein
MCHRTDECCGAKNNNNEMHGRWTPAWNKDNDENCDNEDRSQVKEVATNEVETQKTYRKKQDEFDDKHRTREQQ